MLWRNMHFDQQFISALAYSLVVLRRPKFSLASGPVDLVAIGQQQGTDHALNFVEVAAGAGASLKR